MILGGKVINPGELRTQIVLERRAVTDGTGGFQTPTWTQIGVVYAKWTNAHGSESLQAALVGSDALATVLIRYHSTIDSACAILKGLDRYEIVSIDNIGERNEFLELRVRKMKGG